MPIEITIPRLGWSMEEGNFVAWLKKDGELVKAGEPLFTLESEKAAQDVEATDGGILRIPAKAPQAGEVVRVGQVIGLLIAENEKVDGKAVPAAAKPDQTLKTSDGSPGPRVDGDGAGLPSAGNKQPPAPYGTSSPRARRRAAQLGVDPSRLQGSGRSGRVIEADVLKAAKTPASSGLSTMRRAIAQRTATSF